MEQYASAIVTSGYLKIAVTVLSFVALGLVLMDLKIVRTLEAFKPMVIRIDEIGRAQAVSYESLAYKPEYKETKYFLTRFCQLYYRRNRSTINDDFSQAMYFLDGKLASDTIQQFSRRTSSRLSLPMDSRRSAISTYSKSSSNPWKKRHSRPLLTSFRSSIRRQITP